MNKKTRIEYNRQILAAIAATIEQFPEWRFHQILQNMNITDSSGTDKWFEESYETAETLSTFTKNIS